MSGWFRARAIPSPENKQADYNAKTFVVNSTLPIPGHIVVSFVDEEDHDAYGHRCDGCLLAARQESAYMAGSKYDRWLESPRGRQTMAMIEHDKRWGRRP